MTFQVIPPQSQPVDEQSGGTLDRVWYRFLSSLFANALTFVGAPATSSSVGTAGQVAFDSNFLYVCVDTNTWKRVALSSW